MTGLDVPPRGVKNTDLIRVLTCGLRTLEVEKKKKLQGELAS
jgi:hypothetical protein